MNRTRTRTRARARARERWGSAWKITVYKYEAVYICGSHNDHSKWANSISYTVIPEINFVIKEH